MSLARDNQKFYSDTRLIGVGNEYRQDDGVGIFIVRNHRLRRLPGVYTVEHRGDATNLIDLWKDAGTVFVFDAVFSGNKPGTIYRFNALKEELPQELFRFSSHTFSIVDAIGFSHILNQLPNELIVFGVEGKNYGSGQGMSSECKQAAFEVIRRVLEEMRKLGKGNDDA